MEFIVKESLSMETKLTTIWEYECGTYIYFSARGRLPKGELTPPNLRYVYVFTRGKEGRRVVSFTSCVAPGVSHVHVLARRCDAPVTSLDGRALWLSPKS